MMNPNYEYDAPDSWLLARIGGFHLWFSILVYTAACTNRQPCRNPHRHPGNGGNAHPVANNALNHLKTVFNRRGTKKTRVYAAEETGRSGVEPPG
ncbi:MAG: hypothetical protein ACP5PQ_03670 [Thermoproteota archaeon]